MIRLKNQFSQNYILAIMWILMAVTYSCNEPTDNSSSNNELGIKEILINALNDTTRRPNRFMNNQMAGFFKKKMNRAENDEQYQIFRFKYGNELFRAGETEKAIKILKHAINESSEIGLDSEMTDNMRELLAVAYFRAGEQENCIHDHNAQSCIFPVSGTGVYRMQSGPREAIKLYLKILEDHPDNLSIKWLLNIANQTIGLYPDSVPQAHLLDPTQYESDYIMNPFMDIAEPLGLKEWDVSGGAILEDFDNDGLLDLIVSGMSLDDQIRYYKYLPEGYYEEKTIGSGLEGQLGGLNILHGDINNDGFHDLLILRGGWMFRRGDFPNSLLLNQSDGTFKDITKESGIFSRYPTQAASFEDFNSDGWLDLIIVNEISIERDQAGQGVEFYINDGKGGFIEKSKQAGLEIKGLFKGVATGDLNNDGKPDIYISDYYGVNHLFQNKGNIEGNGLRFEEITELAGVSNPINSFPVWFWDFNQDGWEDIFVFTYLYKDPSILIHEYSGMGVDSIYFPGFYKNLGNGKFENVAIEKGLDKVLFAMGANFGDVDNDGNLDFYIGTGNPEYSSLYPNRMFRNAGESGFEEITTTAGVGHLQKGHAISFGDIDRDGDQDILANMGGAYYGDIFQNVLFENPGNGNGFVVLRLYGTQSNKAAIGARVKLEILENGATRTLYRTVSTGSSFGANSLQLEIGLGKAQSVESVFIKWPDGNNKWIQYGGIQPGFLYEYTEGVDTPVTKDWIEVPFAKDREVKHHHPGL